MSGTAETIFVIGHRNPDTDAICSAVAYADLLQRTGRPNAIAASCGPANSRTEFALRTAGVPAPRIMMDVRPEVRDVCRRDPITARTDEVFFEIYERMREHQLRAIPMISDGGELVGILNLLDLLEIVFHLEDQDGDSVGSRQVHSSLAKIRAAIGGRFLTEKDADRRETMFVMVGAMSERGFTERLDKLPAERLLVVSGDRPTVQVPALERGVRGLVVTGGYELSPGLLRLAEDRGVTVISSPCDTATTILRIRSARSIESAITREFIGLADSQLVEEIRLRVHRASQSIFPVLNDDGQLFGVLSKSDLVGAQRIQLVLVDHNELDQAVPGADEADILEVLDHHRLGGSFRSAQPIRFLVEPVGSTCTLVTRRYRDAGLTPSSGIALCLAAGIISDTLYLRSPTATAVDRQMLDWLSPHCPCNLSDFAQEFFEVGSALRSCTPQQVVREDVKEFREHGYQFSISQIEENGFELFWKRKDELQGALEELTFASDLDFSGLLVTDITTNSSLLLLSQVPAGWEETNYPRIGRNLYELAGIVSRKKQLLPLVLRLLEHNQQRGGG